MRVSEGHSRCRFVCVPDEKSTSASGRYDRPTADQPKKLLRAALHEVWFIDSGASGHMTFSEDWFTQLRVTSGDTVSLSDDGVCEVSGIGTI